MQIPIPPRIVIVLGPTASGKSELALRLAETCNGELVNADSLQVYRGLDIGTAKPDLFERQRVPHHLIDILNPDEPFSAADFLSCADAAIQDITGRGRVPIVVGGTGLYLRTLIHGLVSTPGENRPYRQQMEQLAAQEGSRAVHRLLTEVDPAAAARIHPNNLVRTIRALEVYQADGRPLSTYWNEHQFAEERYRYLKIGINIEREELSRRIEKRVDTMIARGLVDEVRQLHERGYGRELKPLGSIGYREIAACLAGELSLKDAQDLMVLNTRRYAKRQMTWFRQEEPINWVEYPQNFASIQSYVIQFFS